MYISDKFVFTELHKTAGTHIGKWLKNIAPGKQVGKHNKIPAELRDRFIIGSIRNPWDWYVSLWGYGCDQKGSVWHQTSNTVNFRYYWQQLPKEMGRNYLSPGIFIKQYFSDIKKPLDLWANAYSNSTDPDCFKSWLKLIFNHSRKLDIREGYGFSPLSNEAGLLSYRFFKFFTTLDQKIYSSNTFSKNSTLSAVWKKYKFADHFIRMESLEEDLIQAMRRANVDMSEELKSSLREASTKKTIH